MKMPSDNLSKNLDNFQSKDDLKTQDDLKIVKDHTALLYTAVTVILYISTLNFHLGILDF